MPYLNAIGTAVPPIGLSQMQIAAFMATILQLEPNEQRKLQALYRSTKIEKRHSVLSDYGKQLGDFNFLPNTPDLEPFPRISQRMALYKEQALPLVLEAISACNLSQMGCNYADITHLITVSCTGMYAPGLDIELVEQLGLPTTIQRTAINFMGCYGAFNGLKVADAICRANAHAKVLLVCVELCTIHFQKKSTEDHLLANSLFADGAAAVLIEATPRGGKPLKMKSFYCDLLPEGKNEMAWQVADFGFEMILSSYIPKLVKKGIRTLMERLLQEADIHQDDISFYAMHPGGKAILEAIEQSLKLTKHDNRYAYEILRQYGNMSSCTVLFVLQALLNDLRASDAGKNILSCAFGPGLTLESMLLEVGGINEVGGEK